MNKQAPKKPKSSTAATATPTPAPKPSAAHGSGRRPVSKKSSSEIQIVQEYTSEKGSNKLGAPRIRFEVPAVAKHCARVLIVHNMDFDSAAAYLLQNRSVEPSQLAGVAHSLEHNPFVKEWVEKELTTHGLDDNSKEAYVQELWSWFRYGSESKATKAAGILGRGFIAEKVETEKPEELPLQGLNGAVQSMLGNADERGTTDDTAIKEPAPGPTDRSDVHVHSEKPPADLPVGRSARIEAARKKLSVRDVKSN